MGAIFQIIRFGAVGFLATAVHSGVYIFVLHSTDMTAQVANFFGFLAAVIVSATGHARYTFQVAPERRNKGMLRFIGIAILGFALNAYFVYLTTDVIGLKPEFAAWFILCATPVFIFLMSKYWAFAHPEDQAN